MELMEYGVSLETEAVKVKVPKGAKPGTEVTFSLPGGRSTTVAYSFRFIEVTSQVYAPPRFMEVTAQVYNSPSQVYDISGL